MELELGLKITRTPHDFSSSSDACFARIEASPRFVSKETDAAIVLTGYMKGYRKENISIKINEHGTRIVINGEKPVQEMIMMGWIMLKKQVEMREFRKVFRIPEGVVLNRIKAKFNQDGSMLTIHFPKLIKGITGIGIDEEPEETNGRIHEAESSGVGFNDQISSKDETRQITEENFRGTQAEFIDKLIETNKETNGYQEKEEENRIVGANAVQSNKDLVTDPPINIPDSNDHEIETHEAIDENEAEQATKMAESATEQAGNENDKINQLEEVENEEEHSEKTEKIVEEEQNEDEIREKVFKKTWNTFVIAGSAFLASSLVVVVLGFARAKRKDKK